MKHDASSALFAEAQRWLPGGVNSPVRAYRAVGMDPPFIARARGSHLTDADGNDYVDYVGSWGPMILGHAHPVVRDAILEAVEGGTSCGAPTGREVAMARLICELVPSVEMVRLVSSGTEAVMSAIRLARGCTGRDKIVKFEGCYHGHSDGLLVKAGSGALTTGVPDSAGVPLDFARNTLSAAYNDPSGIRDIFDRMGGEVAAVIVEPVAGNMGLVPPSSGWLELLRELCTRHGALLIFDEVITGFRLALGGAQAVYGVKPDLSTFGKIIGGGLPVGAYGGRRELMQRVSPLGPVYQAGTLSGNPVAMAAGLATLGYLRDHPEIYASIDRTASRLADLFRAAAVRHAIPLAINRTGSLLGVFFTPEPVGDFASAMRSDTGRFAAYFRAMSDQGIFLPPSQFEALFVSAAHDEADLARTEAAINGAFAALEKQGVQQ